MAFTDRSSHDIEVFVNIPSFQPRTENKILSINSLPSFTTAVGCVVDVVYYHSREKLGHTSGNQFPFKIWVKACLRQVLLDLRMDGGRHFNLRRSAKIILKIRKLTWFFGSFYFNWYSFFLPNFSNILWGFIWKWFINHFGTLSNTSVQVYHETKVLVTLRFLTWVENFRSRNLFAPSLPQVYDRIIAIQTFLKTDFWLERKTW